MTIYTATEARTAVQTYQASLVSNSDVALGLKYSYLFVQIKSFAAIGRTSIGIYTTETIYSELRPFLIKQGYTVFQIPLPNVSQSGVTFISELRPSLPIGRELKVGVSLYNTGTPTIINWTGIT